jgi:hypothetical protein
VHSNQIDNNNDEFAALSRSKRREDIATKEIKKAVAKAIQILLSKLNPSEELMENLSIAYALP